MGTTAEFDHTSSGFGRIVKDHEPLGQEVMIEDISIEPDPPANEIPSYWIDLEWQCARSSDKRDTFADMPVHCQIKFLQTASGWQGGPAFRDPNAKIVSSNYKIRFKSGSGRKPFLDSRSNKLLSYGTGSTAKRGMSVETDEEDDDKCTFDKNSPHCVVNVPEPVIDMEETGWTGAGESSSDKDCPPTIKQLAENRWLRKQLSKLLLEESGHRTNDNLENGGWVYLYTAGRSKGLFFFEPVEAARRGKGFLNLENAPRRGDAILIAWVHTHPYTEYIQENANLTEGAGQTVNLPTNRLDSPQFLNESTGPSQQDYLKAETSGIPQLVVYEAVKEFGSGSDSTVWIRYFGPDRIDDSNCK